MLTKPALTAIIESYQRDGEFGHFTLQSSADAVLQRLHEQATTARQGLSYSRAYFIVTFTLVRVLEWHLLHPMPGHDVAEWQREALRTATLQPLQAERVSLRANRGGFRITGSVTPDVLSAFRRLLSRVSQACATPTGVVV